MSNIISTAINKQAELGLTDYDIMNLIGFAIDHNIAGYHTDIEDDDMSDDADEQREINDFVATILAAAKKMVSGESYE